jgi:hypothetical protein
MRRVVARKELADAGAKARGVPVHPCLADVTQNGRSAGMFCNTLIF